MFVSDTHLPQILPPEAYFERTAFDAEVERLFVPAWHCVGTLDDLPNDGDFITLNLLERPLICWRKGDSVHTFLNVCAHRFSLLSDKPCGHAGDRLKCQYHGWEYDEAGNTRKIPDARSFRPLEPGQLGLRPFRTELAGKLIFVTLDPAAPPLAEWLGPLYAMCEDWFGPDARPVLAHDEEHQCNWKVVAENTLEGYHVESVHPTTFGHMPEPEDCSHEFHDTWDIYKDDYTHHRNNGMEKFVSRLAGVEPDFTWKHLIRYPHIMFAEMSLFRWVHVVTPISPSRCRAIWRIVCRAGKPGTLKGGLLYRGLRRWCRKFMNRVIHEDAAIYAAIQNGVASGPRPYNSGLISIREERIFHFQEWVKRETAEGEGHKTNGQHREPAAVGNDQCETDAKCEDRGSHATETVRS